MNFFTSRRSFLKTSAAVLGSCAATASHWPVLAEQQSAVQARFKVSLAQWSLHRALRDGKLDNLDFPRIARETFGLDAVEWSNNFAYVDDKKLGIQPKGKSYLDEVKRRTNDLGVANLLIMCDRVGNLGDPAKTRRSTAVQGHFAWVEAAQFLGCHSIRVNAGSDSSLSPEQQKELCIDGLSRLCEFAQPHDINIIVENHGGLSSNGAWLASVIQGVPFKNCGTLPDFGNFYVARNWGSVRRYRKAKVPYENDPIYKEDDAGLAYDRYQGVADLMPYAQGVSAKSHDFDEAGEEVNTDYCRMLQIVADAGYSGYIGIEYEGKKIPEEEGVRLTKALLEKAFAAVTPSAVK